MTTSLIYAGIGSRETPPAILTLMTAIAVRKHIHGYTLRSGGAKGADLAFEAGAGSAKEIFRPADATKAAHDLSAKYHPAWGRCSPWAKALHARNAQIILGRNLDSPVGLVICWTPNADASGGTGQGIRIAKGHGIEVRDLGEKRWLEHYQTFATS